MHIAWDFNASYILASSETCRGSSGTPVIQEDGYAVAMPVGGHASHALCLALDRPLRTFKCLQKGEPITRGDIQRQFLLKPLKKCQTLGLRARYKEEMKERHPGWYSMLVVETVLPGGPSSAKIKDSDILIDIKRGDGRRLHRGGNDIEVEVPVLDRYPCKVVSISR